MRGSYHWIMKKHILKLEAEDSFVDSADLKYLDQHFAFLPVIIGQITFQ